MVSYNKKLTYYGLRDHQVQSRPHYSKSTFAYLFFTRVGYFLFMTSLSLPGIILNLPMGIIADRISQQKAKEAKLSSSVKIAGNDVLATWKVMVCMILIPSFYLLYTLCLSAIVYNYPHYLHFFIHRLMFDSHFVLEPAFHLPIHYIAILAALNLFVLLPAMSYTSMRLIESGLDELRSVQTLLFATFDPKKIEELGSMREELKIDIESIVEEFGPQLFADYHIRKQMLNKGISNEHDDASNKGNTSATLILVGGGLQGLQKFMTSPVMGAGDYMDDWDKVEASEVDDYFFFGKDKTNKD